MIDDISLSFLAERRINGKREQLASRHFGDGRVSAAIAPIGKTALQVERHRAIDLEKPNPHSAHTFDCVLRYRFSQATQPP